MDEKEEGSRRYAGLDRLVKKSCRKDKKEWLEHKGAEAQEAADRNDSKTLYRIVHELTGTKKDELKLHHATTALEGEAGKIGLRISVEKSKIMHVSNTAQTWGVTVEDSDWPPHPLYGEQQDSKTAPGQRTFLQDLKMLNTAWDDAKLSPKIEVDGE
ncbi:hypothetical protein G5714_010600 [Onychostoma macrolepis]|uniref:Uncharacterized protein n=1 Tax=Onychostoma macrolepis TaxID=369639 RepID=A0A7J6CKV9_9TELE|nr:hypothetical protein G5714_010600 [Onychostoma macrolepis]